MSTEAKHVATPYSRSRGLIFGFLLGVAIAAVVMGVLWSSDSARQEATIRELGARISEKDATITTLYAQLSAQGKSTGPSKPADEPSGRP